MKPRPLIQVGTYPLGDERVTLAAKPGYDGGELYFPGDERPLGAVVVGVRHDRWDECVEVVLHEALEYALIRVGGRFAPSDMQTQDHSNYLFSVSHVDFTQAVARVASFVTPALPALARVWRKHHRK